jgi:8-oxo-dGTP diphosphatase
MERPQVGIGGIILKDNKVLMAKRRGKFGNGTWGTFGGHLEFGESFEKCVKREAKEELGIEIGIKKLISLSNLIDNEHHYVDMVFLVELIKGDPKILEPEKHEDLEWFDIDNLPSPLFISIEKAMEALKNNQIVFDSE